MDPPKVPYDANETGCYLRTFTVLKSFKSHQLRLRFEGVDSAFHVWVNGKEIGYSQGARNPSEFDITDVTNVDGENTLAVQVYQWSDGSYLEAQVSCILNYEGSDMLIVHRINGGSVASFGTSIWSPSLKFIFKTFKFRRTSTKSTKMPLYQSKLT